MEVLFVPDAWMVVPAARMGKSLMVQWTEMCLIALIVLILMLSLLVPNAPYFLLLSLMIAATVLC